MHVPPDAERSQRTRYQLAHPAKVPPTLALQNRDSVLGKKGVGQTQPLSPNSLKSVPYRESPPLGRGSGWPDPAQEGARQAMI